MIEKFATYIRTYMCVCYASLVSVYQPFGAILPRCRSRFELLYIFVSAHPSVLPFTVLGLQVPWAQDTS